MADVVPTTSILYMVMILRDQHSGGWDRWAVNNYYTASYGRGRAEAMRTVGEVS